ncbi:hypothetical protein [Proteiniphilum sp.]|uniref:hypothetical protein n=1 Tax=Proteiniphilum sp. TaxID=1926877 RepID=UPI003319B26D
MKKIFYLIGISTLLFLITSCNNEEVNQLEPKVKGYIPVLRGTFGTFTDNNPESGTRAGVIEDRDDFNSAQGERFYWHNGDRVKVLFVDESGTETELIYQAVVPGEEKSNTCDFIVVDNGVTLEDGVYDVYGLYPADGWTKNATTGKWGVSFREIYDQLSQRIHLLDGTSKHAGQYMFMKADAGVTIGEGGSNRVDLSFKHLTSLIRVRVGKPDVPELAKLFRFSLGVKLDDVIPLPLGFESFFVPLDGSLDNLDASSLAIRADNKQNAVGVQIPDDLLESLNGTDFDLFIPILPTGALQSKTLTFATKFYDEALSTQTFAKYIYRTIDREQPIAFEQGKSYFFNIGTPELNE